MNRKEIDALVKLLEEDDNFILSQVEERLRFYYNILPTSTWSVYLKGLPEKNKDRLYNLLRSFNHEWVLEQIRQWTANPQTLNYGLYLVSRVFEPLLEFPSFSGAVSELRKDLPENFMQFPPKDKAVLLVKRFTEWYISLPKFSRKADSVASLDPYSVLQLREGSIITISLLIAAVAELYGVHWLVISDSHLRYTYVIVPDADNDFFLIDTENSMITERSPFSRDAILQELQKGYLQNNLLSMKSLIMGLLQEGVFPPNKLIEEWHIINRFNYLLSLHSQ